MESLKKLDDTFPQYISLFASAFSFEPLEQCELGCVLEMIRDRRWEQEVSLARRRIAQGNQKGYEECKRSLPAVTLSAMSMSRSKEVPIEHRVLKHSGFLQGDVDAKDNRHIEDMAAFRDQVCEDPHVAFAFISPSGLGVKLGIRIDPTRHRESFFAAERYFLEKYGVQIDPSCKDPLRLCFVSYDPDLKVNSRSVPVEVDAVMAAQREKRQWAPEPETTAADIAEMLACVPKRPCYDEWLRIASAVWSVLPMEEGARVLADWSPEEKPGEYTDKHRHRLAEIGIGTLVWYAQRHGFDAAAASRRKRWAGRIRFSEPTMPAKREEFSVDPAAAVQPLKLSNEFILKCFSRQQKGDAELYEAYAREKRLYDHLACVWRVYTKGIWERDDMQETLLDISRCVSDGYGRLIEAIRADMAANPADDPKKDTRHEEIRSIEKRITRMRTTGYLAGVIKFAQSILATKATTFDRDLGLLVVENGTIDFAEGVWREHRASDRITVKTPIHFCPEADCPKWMQFLDYFMAGDKEMIAYLARAVGYSLTGWTDKDTLFFCYGKGANGKSTFTSALKLLAGQLMTTVGIDALLTKMSDNNFDYKKAEMEGKRIVVTDEIPENKALNESAVKSLVGGDEITARRPYEKPYTFEPTHKLWLVGNHKPEVKGTDYGIWRRIHLIPWLVTMPEDRRRPRHEIIAEFREELPGILNWALRGYLEMVDMGGLKPPNSILQATKEYRSESDQFSQFLDERTERDLMSRVGSKELLKAYLAWCEDSGEMPRYRSGKKVVNYMKECGFVVQPSRARALEILGLRLIDPETVLKSGEFGEF